MATAKSDTSLKKNKDDTGAFSWADWTIVDSDIPNLNPKAAAEVDDSWIVIEPTPTDEYAGLKKSTFVVEAWHWAFGWLKQKDNAKKKEKKKNEKRYPKGRDTKSQLMHVNSALEEKILVMCEKIIERAVEETIEENILRNEEIFQKMLTDVIESALVELWEEEESKMEKTENTDTCSNIFDQMLDDTLENACNEVAAEERLDKSSKNLTDNMAENSGTIEETVEKALHRLANGFRRTDSEVVEETETVLKRHEKTLDKIEMFYDRTADDETLRDGDLIKNARKYVQDIIVVSLGILDEEQRTLKEASYEDEDKDDPASGMICEFNEILSAGGGGDFPNNVPRNAVHEANFSLTTTVKANQDDVDDVTTVNDSLKGFALTQNEVESEETVEAVAVELPLENTSLQYEENEQEVEEYGDENLEEIFENEICAVKAENSQDGIIYFEVVKNASNKEIIENGIKKLETENVGRLRRFRNRLSRLCFWRKDHK